MKKLTISMTDSSNYTLNLDDEKCVELMNTIGKAVNFISFSFPGKQSIFYTHAIKLIEIADFEISKAELECSQPVTKVEEQEAKTEEKETETKEQGVDKPH